MEELKRTYIPFKEWKEKSKQIEYTQETPLLAPDGTLLASGWARKNVFQYNRDHVKKGIISLEHLIKIMSINPRKVFRIEGGIEVGQRADIVLLDTNKEWRVDSNNFYSMGKITMFDGREMTGDVVMTLHRGEIVYDNKTK